MRTLVRKISKRLFDPHLKRMEEKSSSKPRMWSWRDINLTVAPGVFHPGLFFSTRVLLKYMLRLPLKGKKVLELGAGSGIISLVAAQRGATVTSTDINPVAIENLKINAIQNGLEVRALVSDLFDHIPDPQFDFIFINPPYYPRNPSKMAERAWYCGEEFEYFDRLFHELVLMDRKSTRIYMVLSEDCAIDIIRDKAVKEGLSFQLERERMVWLEKNYVFLIQ
ncbi:methyltransferase [bacterium SCSIO 12741]|nr:methyltransferase [bacterium SCSIO 12741]